MLESEKRYHFLGAFGAATEGSKEEDGDGAGEEDAGGDLDGRRVVGVGKERKRRRRRRRRWELDGAFFFFLVGELCEPLVWSGLEVCSEGLTGGGERGRRRELGS